MRWFILKEVVKPISKKKKKKKKKSLLSGSTTRKGKKIAYEASLSYESGPLYGRVWSLMEANRKSQKLFPLVKWKKNMELYPVNLMCSDLFYLYSKRERPTRVCWLVKVFVF